MGAWESILIVTALFFLSLIGAYVLFKVLKATARGQYLGFTIGGSLAGFVVIFLLLSYTLQGLQHSDIEVHLVFEANAEPVLEGAEAYYQRIPRGALERTELLVRYKDNLVIVPKVPVEQTIRVWIRTKDNRWWASDHVTSRVRHLLFQPVAPLPGGSNDR